MNISVAVADDQQLFLRSLASLINSFPSFEVVAEALNGKILLEKLHTVNGHVDIVLIDVRMPELDGAGTVKCITAEYPAIRTVALSVNDDDMSVLQMIRAGCSAYLLKDVHPEELKKALIAVHEDGYYNADMISTNYRRLLTRSNQEELKLSDRERTFLALACSDFTYKEIASKMFLSEKTIDGYRESLFSKLNVKSRVGMALEAIKKNLVAV